MGGLRVGVDVGGTFTDIVVFDPATNSLRLAKTPTTPANPVEGIVEGLSASVDLYRVDVLVHATTIGTNTFLGQVGLELPRAVLVTNEGFRDLLEIGRQNRPTLYDLFYEKPPPLIPRSRRYGVRGRIAVDGSELEPLDEDAVREIARRECSRGTKVFVVSFLHSYRNPSHEVRAAEIIRKECPDAYVVVSSEVDPEPMEYERTSTAVVNGLLMPVLSSYLSRLGQALESRGFRGKLLVMQSSGGMASVEEAVKRPAAFIESGPAAGAVAVAYFSRLMGVRKALGFDMGGTTAKASTIINGHPDVVDVYEVGGRVHMGRPLRGTGYPVRYPHVDLAEVSAGGGTIAWIDPGGALRLGPKSAGSQPGPACYGRGGRDPTVTDANLVLGRLPLQLAGGLRLNRRLAEEAIKEKIAKPLGLSVLEAAWAIIQLANSIMAKALRLVTVEKGRDPREFKLFAFGGAGPLHAVELASDLGVEGVIIPRMAGVFSALGLLVADYKHYYKAPLGKPVDEIDEGEVEEVFKALESEAHATLESEGIPPGRRVILRYLDLKYWRQAYTLRVPYTGSIEGTVEEFHGLYEARYGYSSPEDPVIAVSAMVEAVGVVDKPDIRLGVHRLRRSVKPSEREVFVGGGWVRAEVIPWESLQPGDVVRGPAVLEGVDSTALISPGAEGRVDEYGFIRVVMK